LIAILTPKEIERKRMLVSKFKEDAINHIEIQELINLLEKEKHIAKEEVEVEGGNGMLVFAISSLISHLSEYLTSRSGIKEEQVDNSNSILSPIHVRNV
jgi:hypothetical protein